MQRSTEKNPVTHTRLYGFKNRTPCPGVGGIPSHAEERLDQAELARRVGMQQPNSARLEWGNYDRVSLPTLKKVARTLGAEIEIKLSA